MFFCVFYVQHPYNMRIKDGGNLGSASGRAKLKQRREPYWVPIVRGCALGYRKGKTGGSWIARVPGKDRPYDLHALGAADDLTDGNGLTYKTALDEARKVFRMPTAAPGSHTVAYVLDRYLAHVKSANPESTIRDTESRVEGILKPVFGAIKLAKLRATDITDWQKEAAKTRKPDTVNRVITILKAALNRAWKVDRLVADDSEWRQVSRLEGGTSRKIFLTGAQPGLLLKHCSPRSFQRLVQAALLIGARYGELTALRVHDFDQATGTLEILAGKTGGRTVYLSSESVAYFASLAAGRPANARLLPRDDGSQWGKNHHQRPFIAAVKAANLADATTFYALRHTHISAALLAGVNIQVLAENCGTSVRMIEQHYGKFLRADRRAMFDKMKPLVA